MRPIGSFLCGAVLTALTVIWIHVAAVAVGASVYALPEVLLFVVIGVALGTRAAARSKDPASPLLCCWSQPDYSSCRPASGRTCPPASR